MKILHLINTLSAGGAELHLLTLCRHLKLRGVQVEVACLREQVTDSRTLRPDFEEEGIQISNLNAERFYNLHFLGKLIHIIRKENPDILHTHLPRADLAGALVHLIYPNIPWICSMHNIYGRHWSGRWILPLFSYIWRKPDVLLAISHAVKEWLVMKKKLCSEKIKVVHYGIEARQFAHSMADLKNDWGMNEHAVVGSVGRLEPRKGHEILIQAMQTVLKLRPNTILVIAGHDPWGYSRRLESFIDKLNLKGAVRLIGFRKDIPSFLHSLDIFAFASCSEGFGQVIVEAMAAGKPVVASRIPPITEIVVDGETGFLVNPNNPQAFAQTITWLLAHPRQSMRIGKQGLKRVRSLFSAERMAKETLFIYEQLLSQRR